MDDLLLRFLVAGGIGVVATGLALAFRAGRALRRRPFRATGLEPGLHLFSSQTCVACARARDALVEAGVPFVEHTYETSSPLLEANRVERVPTVVWVPTGGNVGWVAEGVPGRRSLARWLGP